MEVGGGSGQKSAALCLGAGQQAICRSNKAEIPDDRATGATALYANLTPVSARRARGEALWPLIGTLQLRVLHAPPYWNEFP